VNARFLAVPLLRSARVRHRPRTGHNEDGTRGLCIRRSQERLLAASECAEQLFGEDGAEAVADWIVEDPKQNLQQMLFPEMAGPRAPKVSGQGRRRKALIDPGDIEIRRDREATTLDRVHAAMLLQRGGRTHALRALVEAELERGPDFLCLANALSALYPVGSEEKRLLDAMLLAVPR